MLPLKRPINGMVHHNSECVRWMKNVCFAKDTKKKWWELVGPMHRVCVFMFMMIPFVFTVVERKVENHLCCVCASKLETKLWWCVLRQWMSPRLFDRPKVSTTDSQLLIVNYWLSFSRSYTRRRNQNNIPEPGVWAQRRAHELCTPNDIKI